MERFVNRIIEGDCLEVMAGLPDQSIDMILCDLPYGSTANKWDVPIDLDQLWAQYRRIIKVNGVIALTGHGKFTGQLIASNYDWFKYKIVWIKSKHSNFLQANRQPLKRHEDICIFYKNMPLYQPQKIPGAPYNRGVRRKNLADSYGKYNAAPTLNIDGARFPHDVLFFEEEELTDWIYLQTAEREGVYHPTQKPVDLGRWFIRTYTKPGEIVLDNACGSGSFLVSAIRESRRFIGIEKNQQSYHFKKPVDFVEIARARVKEAMDQQNDLFN